MSLLLAEQIRMQQHREQIGRIVPQASNGIIIYTYNDNRSEDGYQPPSTLNLGDYIQTLAARQFLPQVDCRIDRDQLARYDGAPVNLIINAFHRFRPGNAALPGSIHPLCAAMHLHNPEQMPERTLEYLKKLQPIGCRDHYSRDFLLAHGIEAYFSGCLTLTLREKYYVPPAERGNEICLVDHQISFWRKPFINLALRKILKNYPDCPISHYTHRYPIEMSPDDALREAERMIGIYSRAKLVITKRLHVALPCLGMGVPVILVVSRYDYPRFSGLISFLNRIGVDENGKFSIQVKTDGRGEVVNDVLHEPYAEHLIQLCRTFVNS